MLAEAKPVGEMVVRSKTAARGKTKNAVPKFSPPPLHEMARLNLEYRQSSAA